MYFIDSNNHRYCNIYSRIKQKKKIVIIKKAIFVICIIRNKLLWKSIPQIISNFWCIPSEIFGFVHPTRCKIGIRRRYGQKYLIKNCNIYLKSKWIFVVPTIYISTSENLVNER